MQCLNILRVINVLMVASRVFDDSAHCLALAVSIFRIEALIVKNWIEEVGGSGRGQFVPFGCTEANGR
jgi:hypothetical protein